MRQALEHIMISSRRRYGPCSLSHRPLGLPVANTSSQQRLSVPISALLGFCPGTFILSVTSSGQGSTTPKAVNWLVRDSRNLYSAGTITSPVCKVLSCRILSYILVL